MKRFFRLLNYLVPYKWFVVQNVLYNILGAFFALFSFVMVIPFLKVVFDNQEMVTEAMEFELSTEYLMHTLNFYIGKLMGTHDAAGALIIVSLFVVVFSLLKNGFIFAANFMLAPIRAFMVRDIRNDIYRKVLRLPLSFYTEARKAGLHQRFFDEAERVFDACYRKAFLGNNKGQSASKTSPTGNIAHATAAVKAIASAA